VDLIESRSRAFFRRAYDSRAARESSARAYASRRGKPEVCGASCVAQRAFGASLERHSEKGTESRVPRARATRASAHFVRSREAGSERGESGCG
jgi:hypothetical protein